MLNKKGYSYSFILLSIILILFIISLFILVNHHKSQFNTSSYNSGTTKTNTYTDSAKAYIIAYPATWKVKEKTINAGNNLPTLDKTQAVLTPNNVPSGAMGKTWLSISTFNSNDMSKVFEFSQAAINLNINGYKALYYQAVTQPAKGTQTVAGAFGYTDDYYAITNNKITVVFYFREKQSSYSSNANFDVSNIVPSYKAVIHSIKFN